jgi:hypothetical protein
LITSGTSSIRIAVGGQVAVEDAIVRKQNTATEKIFKPASEIPKTIVITPTGLGSGGKLLDVKINSITITSVYWNEDK